MARPFWASHIFYQITMEKNETKHINTLVPATISNADIPATFTPTLKNATAAESTKPDAPATKSGPGGWGGIIESGINAVTNITGIVTDGVVRKTQAETGYYEPVVQEDKSYIWLIGGGVAALVLIIVMVIIFKN